VIYKQLYFQIIIRVLLIFGNCYALSLVIINTTHYHAIFAFSILLIIQIILLIRYLNITNRVLAGFFQSAIERDTSFSFSDVYSQSSLSELNNRLSDLRDIIKAEKLEKESRLFFVNRIIEHVDIGLLSFNQSGEIEFLNSAARIFIGIKHIKNLAEIKKVNPELYEIFINLLPGEQKLIKIKTGTDSYQLAVKVSEFKLKEKCFRLVSINDIQNELDKKELESWQKLIRVLAHEIMSSVTPITSLSEAIVKNISDK